MKKIALKYVSLFLLTIIGAIALVPLIFILELQLLPYYPTQLQAGIEIGLGDALTMASVFGAVGVFVLERYWSEVRNQRERRYSGALRLMLKQIREQDEPATIEEHWRIFREDVEGRDLYCDGAFGDISLDDFTAQIYALRLESQIDITYGAQVVLRTPFRIKAKKLGDNEKDRVIQVLEGLAESKDDEFLRESAIGALADISDAAVVPLVQRYLDDENPRIRLAASKALIELVAFPEA